MKMELSSQRREMLLDLHQRGRRDQELLIKAARTILLGLYSKCDSSAFKDHYNNDS